jgi:hypothetical protein
MCKWVWGSGDQGVLFEGWVESYNVNLGRKPERRGFDSQLVGLRTQHFSKAIFVHRVSGRFCFQALKPAERKVHKGRLFLLYFFFVQVSLIFSSCSFLGSSCHRVCSLRLARHVPSTFGNCKFDEYNRLRASPLCVICIVRFLLII